MRIEKQVCVGWCDFVCSRLTCTDAELVEEYGGGVVATGLVLLCQWSEGLVNQLTPER